MSDTLHLDPVAKRYRERTRQLRKAGKRYDNEHIYREVRAEVSRERGQKALMNVQKDSAQLFN